MFNIPLLDYILSKKEEMEDLAKLYLLEYIKRNNLNLKEKESYERLKELVNTLDFGDCRNFFEKNELKKRKFKSFRKYVKKEYKKMRKETRKKSDGQNNNVDYNKVLDSLLAYLKWEKLSLNEQENLYQTLETMPLEKWQEIISWKEKGKYYTETEYENLRMELLKKMKQNKDKNIDPDIIIKKYIEELKKSDYTAYENLCLNLTREQLLKENEELRNFDTNKLNEIISEIKKLGKGIAISKILELPKIKTYVEYFQYYLYNHILSKEDALKEIANIPINSNIELSKFNKELLKEHLLAKLNINSKTNDKKESKPNVEEILTNIKAILNVSLIKDIITFYKEIEKGQKEYLHCETMNDIEFAKTKEEIINLIEKTLAEKIWEKDDLRKEENIILRNHLKQYQMPINLEDIVLTEIERKRQKINSENYLKLSERVEIKKENEGKGKVVGYYIEKDKKITLLTNEEELKIKLKEGYIINGYDVEYFKNFKKRNVYVKENEITKIPNIKESLKKHWKINLTGLVIVLALIIASKVIDNKKKNFYEYEIEDITKNINHDVVMDEEEILREINKTREEYEIMRENLLHIQNNMANYQENNTSEIQIGNTVIVNDDAFTFPDAYSMASNQMGEAKDCDETEIKIVFGKIYVKDGIIDIAKTEEVAMNLEKNGYNLIGYSIGNQYSLYDDRTLVEEGKIKKEEVKKVRIK